VDVSFLGQGPSPRITKVDFELTSTIHAIPMRSCSASSAGNGHGCERMYDGLSTYWFPNIAEWQGGSAWVEFRFSRAEIVNRMFFRHHLPTSASNLLLAQQLERHDMDITAHEHEWIELVKRSTPQKFDVIFDDGSKHTQVVEFGGETVDKYGFAGSPTTLQLPKTTTASVRLAIADPAQLVLSEVNFWHSAVLSMVGKKMVEADSDDASKSSADNSTAAAHTSTALVVRDEFEAPWAQHLLQADGQHVAVDEMGVLTMGFFSAVWDAIKLAAMYVCLAALKVVIAVLSVVQAVIDGIASILIKALEIAIKMMGPHFFEIIELYIMGKFDALAMGKVELAFKINMWLFNFHIKWSFQTQFTLGSLISSLFKKSKGDMHKLKS
jgi:hypothetical protein